MFFGDKYGVDFIFGDISKDLEGGGGREGRQDYAA